MYLSIGESTLSTGTGTYFTWKCTFPLVSISFLQLLVLFQLRIRRLFSYFYTFSASDTYQYGHFETGKISATIAGGFSAVSGGRYSAAKYLRCGTSLVVTPFLLLHTGTPFLSFRVPFLDAYTAVTGAFIEIFGCVSYTVKLLLFMKSVF